MSTKNISDCFHKESSAIGAAYGEFINEVVKPDYWITFTCKNPSSQEAAEKKLKNGVIAKLSRKNIWTIRKNGNDTRLKAPLRGLNQHIAYTIDYDLQPINSMEKQREVWHFHIGMRFDGNIPKIPIFRRLLNELWEGTVDVQPYYSGGASEYGYNKHRNSMFRIGCPRTGKCNNNGRTCIHEDSWSALLSKDLIQK